MPDPLSKVKDTPQSRQELALCWVALGVAFTVFSIIPHKPIKTHPELLQKVENERISVFRGGVINGNVSFTELTF